MTYKATDKELKGRNPLVREYMDTIMELLIDNGYLLVSQSETEIEQRFAKHWKPADRSKTSAGTERWRNDIHWARARLTMKSYTMTIPGKDDDDILILSPHYYMIALKEMLDEVAKTSAVSIRRVADLLK